MADCATLQQSELEGMGMSMTDACSGQTQNDRENNHIETPRVSSEAVVVHVFNASTRKAETGGSL